MRQQSIEQHQVPQQEIMNYSNNNQIQESPQLIKCCIDSLRNKNIVCYWVLFFLIVFVIYLCTLALPLAVFYKHNQSLLSQCQGNLFLGQQDLAPLCLQFDYINNPNFGGIIYDVKSLNQFIIIKVTLKRLENNIGTNFGQNIKFKFYLYGLDGDTSVSKQLVNSADHNIDVQCNANELYCEEISLAYIPQIKYRHYAFMAKFDDNDASILLQYAKEPTFHFEMVNSKYTTSLIIIRYFFLFFSILALSLFYLQLKKLENFHWVIEQKLTLYLSILLIMFNDPLYVITILVPNFFSAFLSVLCVVNFVAFFIIFLLTVLHRIHVENGQKRSKVLDKKKIGFGLTIWFFMIYMYSYFSYKHLKDPAVTTQTELKGFAMFVKVMVFLIFSIYMISLAYLYYAICKQYSKKIWRNKLFVIFEIYFIFCLAIFMYSASFDIYQSIGNRVLLTIALLNLQVFYLQIMYSPSEEGLREAKQLKNIEGRNQQVYEQLDESIHQIDIQFDSQPNSGVDKNQLAPKKRESDSNILVELAEVNKSQDKKNIGSNVYQQVREPPNQLSQEQVGAQIENQGAGGQQNDQALNPADQIEIDEA